MFLLDTNVVSELRRTRPHGAVLAWLQAVEDAHLHLATVTLGEIQAGIELTCEQDPDKARVLETWLDQVSQSFNILPMDGAAFRCWARLIHRQSDTPISQHLTPQVHPQRQQHLVRAPVTVPGEEV